MSGWLTGKYRALIIQDAEVIGYVLFRRDANWLYLRHFVIVSAFRRQGLGKLAIQKLSEAVWKGNIRLEVLAGNPGGIAFWKSVGFSIYTV